MPYRRLPNTDQARVRALKAAVEKGEMYNVRDLAITLKTLFEARNFYSLDNEHIITAAFDTVDTDMGTATWAFSGKNTG